MLQLSNPSLFNSCRRWGVKLTTH